MKGVLYIPYGNGDAKNGFKCKRNITAEQYVKMENNEHKEFEYSVSELMYTQYGNNLAYNNYYIDKRKFNYDQQKYDFYQCPCVVLDINGKPQKYEELAEHMKKQEQFVLILNLNDKILKEEDGLETTLKLWFGDSLKVKKCHRLSDIEVMKHLPKKDFKLKIEAENSMIVLKDCKFMKFMSSSSINSFAIIVNKVVFVKE